MSWIKTFLFFFLLIEIVIIQYWFRNSHEYNRGLRKFFYQSENSKEIYTGKIKPVYEPLDQAYQITENLKELVKGRIDSKKHKVWPTLSLWVDPDDLYGEEKGIFFNGYKKGRLWERAAYLRYYKENKLVFESYVGLRVHGNGGRAPSVKKKGMRVYFKKEYGARSFKAEPGISFTRGTPVKRMVIRKETDPDIPFNFFFHNDFASFILHQLGGLGPKFQHVALYMNGELYGYSTMTAFLSFDQIKHSLKRDDFVFAKLRGSMNIRDHILLDRLRFKSEKYPDVDFDFFDSKLELDTIVGILLAVIYTGNGDWMQGMYLKELGPQHKWKYIAWDFDNSFYASESNSDITTEHLYDIQSVELVMRLKRGKIPWSVFNRLIFTDKKFQKYFSEKVDLLFEILESQDTNDRLDYYQALANDSTDSQAQSSLEELRVFIANRKRVVCRDLKELVKLVPSSCQTSSKNN